MLKLYSTQAKKPPVAHDPDAETTNSSSGQLERDKEELSVPHYSRFFAADRHVRTSNPSPTTSHSHVLQLCLATTLISHLVRRNWHCSVFSLHVNHSKSCDFAKLTRDGSWYCVFLEKDWDRWERWVNFWVELEDGMRMWLLLPTRYFAPDRG